jgi:L,D-transpeptidase YbiS
MKQKGLPPEALRACAHRGLPPTRYFLVVDIGRQTTTLFGRLEAWCSRSFPSPRPVAAGRRRNSSWTKDDMRPRHRRLRIFRCSTSKFGVGETANSYMTPRGLHRIAKKIGGGWPVGTTFTGRKVTGFTWQGKPTATITTRILWLEGLEPGFNRGGNVDSHSRYIYIHGTGNETTLGRPDSHGCVHVAAADLIPLYDLIPEGTLVWIA